MIQMQAYEINVTKIEEWQTVKDTGSLEQAFERAKSAIVNGESVFLLRGKERFDELTTLEDLEAYRQQVFKYL